MDINAVLFSFAANTGLPLDDPNLHKKYVAVHINVVPTHLVYNYVGDDYRLLELEAPLKAYKKIDAQTFVHVMRGTKISPSISFNNFKDSVPLLPKEEWKQMAYFVGLSFCSDFKFVASVWDRPLDNAFEASKVNTLQKQLCAVKVTGDYAKDVGAVIAKLAPLGFEVVEPDSVPTGVQHFEPKIQITPSKHVGESLANLRPLMEEYRIKAKLPPTIDTKKLAKQMLCAALGVGCESLLVGAQNEFTPSPPVNVVLSIVDSMPPLKLTVTDSLSRLAVDTQVYKWSDKTYIKCLLARKLLREQEIDAQLIKEIELF